MKVTAPRNTDCVRAMIVTMEQPMKWPISGINPHTRMIIPMAIGEGRPRIRAKKKTKIDAMMAITI